MARKKTGTATITPPIDAAQSTQVSRSDKKLVSVSLSPTAAKHLRLFKAHMDWTNEEAVEQAIMHLFNRHPNYEVPENQRAA